MKNTFKIKTPKPKVIKFKNDIQKKMIVRLFRTRLRLHRMDTQGNGYYYKSTEFNIKQTKEFYLEVLKNYNITEEFYDQHWP